MSITKIAQATKTPWEETRNILRKRLNRKPYKIPVSHRLLDPDHAKRLEFANWFLNTPTISAERIICTDEAYFYLIPALNKQNNRLWLTERPTDTIEKPLHDQKVLVFFAISARKIFGPYFFEEDVNQKITFKCLKNAYGRKF